MLTAMVLQASSAVLPRRCRSTNTERCKRANVPKTGHSPTSLLAMKDTGRSVHIVAVEVNHALARTLNQQHSQAAPVDVPPVVLHPQGVHLLQSIEGEPDYDVLGEWPLG